MSSPNPEDSSRSARQDPIAPISEKQLARLWQRRAARHEAFHAEDGRSIRVLYPGRPGVTAGPDFRDALLAIEGQGIVQGDVEIHLRQRDWNGHGHHRDPNYNGVALHVALDPAPDPSRTHSGGAPPVVNPSALLVHSTDGQPDNDTRDRLWNILGDHGFRRPGSPNEMKALLNRAGDQRFLAHSRRFRTLLSHQRPEQTLWESVCDALGYRNNRHPFLMLASAAPFVMLATHAARIPNSQREATVRIWLLRLSGFETGPVPAKLGPPLDASEWRLFRVRPPNHPRRRIAGAAALVCRFASVGLVAGLESPVGTGQPARLTASLVVEDADGATAPVGPSRARDIAVNVVLPFLHGHRTSSGHTAKAGAAFQMYRAFGRLTDNEITREMVAALQPPSWGRTADSARRQQGLIHLQRILSGASPAM